MGRESGCLSAGSRSAGRLPPNPEAVRAEDVLVHGLKAAAAGDQAELARALAVLGARTGAPAKALLGLLQAATGRGPGAKR